MEFTVYCFLSTVNVIFWDVIMIQRPTPALTDTGYFFFTPKIITKNIEK